MRRFVGPFVGMLSLVAAVAGGSMFVSAATQIDQLGSDIDGEAAGDESGYAVSLSSDGTIVAIGARQRWQRIQRWACRVYEWDGASWARRAAISAAKPQATTREFLCRCRLTARSSRSVPTTTTTLRSTPGMCACTNGPAPTGPRRAATSTAKPLAMVLGNRWRCRLTEPALRSALLATAAAEPTQAMCVCSVGTGLLGRRRRYRRQSQRTNRIFGVVVV